MWSFTGIDLAKLSERYHKSVTVGYLACLANMSRDRGIPSEFQKQKPAPSFRVWNPTTNSSGEI